MITSKEAFVYLRDKKPVLIKDGKTVRTSIITQIHSEKSDIWVYDDIGESWPLDKLYIKEER